MAERGQNTTLRFGGVSAPISLLKSSGKPRAAQHETKRVLAETGAPTHAAHPSGEDPLGGAVEHRGPSFTDLPPLDATDTQLRAQAAVDHSLAADPLGEEPTASAEAQAADPAYGTSEEWPQPSNPLGLDVGMRTAGGPVVAPGGVIPEGTDATLPTDDAAEMRVAGGVPDPPEYVPPATTVQQGVHLADGTWLDLTDRFSEIDARTKIDGLEVVATISSSAVPRERVRDAHYIAGTDPATFKVLALLWTALRDTDRAAAVRFTKRTAQALGIIVARGSVATTPFLVLLELEWSENMRPPSKRVTGPIYAQLSDAEVSAAVELVEAYEAGPSALNALRDERLGKRAELLALARDGKLDAYVPPPEPLAPSEADDIAEALAAAASWQREHAPA